MKPTATNARALPFPVAPLCLGLLASALVAAPSPPPASVPPLEASVPAVVGYPAVPGKTIVREHEFTVPAPPARVFPLLCPSREYEWLPGWSCELLRSRTGVAELECVFRTVRPEGGVMTWVVSRFEPPHCIEFTCFNTTAAHVMRLGIRLESTASGGTRLHWRRHWIATGPAGEQLVDRFDDAGLDRHSGELAAWLTYYLEHGRMPPAPPAVPKT